MPWSRPFDDPLPHGIRTLQDAADYIIALPKSESKKPHWQQAIKDVMLVATKGGDTMLPRIAMMQALNFGKPKPSIQRSKRVKKMTIIGERK